MGTVPVNAALHVLVTVAPCAAFINGNEIEPISVQKSMLSGYAILGSWYRLPEKALVFPFSDH